MIQNQFTSPTQDRSSMPEASLEQELLRMGLLSPSTNESQHLAQEMTFQPSTASTKVYTTGLSNRAEPFKF